MRSGEASSVFVRVEKPSSGGWVSGETMAEDKASPLNNERNGGVLCQDQWRILTAVSTRLAAWNAAVVAGIVILNPWKPETS